MKFLNKEEFEEINHFDMDHFMIDSLSLFIRMNGAIIETGSEPFHILSIQLSTWYIL